jgi:hypothetical protein
MTNTHLFAHSQTTFPNITMIFLKMMLEVISEDQYFSQMYQKS